MTTETLTLYGLRTGAVVAGLALWFWSQAWISRKAPKGDGLGDVLHDLTAPWNAWLNAHPRAADALLIASSAGIDLFGLFMIAASIFGASLRPFIALLTLFVLRQACQAVCTLPFPPGMIWRRPGFPSLLVTYGTSNDFFFSGHTAIALLGAIEIAQLGVPALAVAAALIALAEMLTVIVLRAHYTMDIFAAAAAAWCATDFARWVAPTLDAWIQ